MSKTKRKSDARDRIVKTAERLFYAEGVRAVGIDRIIAEAEVAKMTLYKHFPSKDDLILGVLQFREEQVMDFFAAVSGKHADAGLNPLDAFFATLKEWFESPGFRGCSFINAAVELADPDHPASQFACQHKCKFKSMIEKIVTETAGSEVAKTVTPTIDVLVAGAVVTAVMEGNSNAAEVAHQAALALVK